MPLVATAFARLTGLRNHLPHPLKANKSLSGREKDEGLALGLVLSFFENSLLTYI